MDAKDRLRELYTSKWKGLCTAMKPIVENDFYEVKPTNPLLLWPCEGDDEYENADIRVMIFGQETNDWGGVFNPNTDSKKEIKRIFEVYNDFYNFDKSYRSQFWNGYWLFTRLLNDKYPKQKICYAWNNIIKIGKAKEMNFPPNYIYDIEQEYFSVVKDEIEILKPHIILFLTGPNYDSRIEDKLGKYDHTVFSTYNENEILKILLPQVNLTYRTYHPHFLYRQGKGVIESYFDSIINDINI